MVAIIKSLAILVQSRIEVLRKAYEDAKFTIEYGFYDDDRR